MSEFNYADNVNQWTVAEINSPQRLKQIVHDYDALYVVANDSHVNKRAKWYKTSYQYVQTYKTYLTFTYLGLFCRCLGQ